MKLGQKQELIVVKTVEFGVYLGEKKDAGEKDRVLLLERDNLQYRLLPHDTENTDWKQTYTSYSISYKCVSYKQSCSP